MGVYINTKRHSRTSWTSRAFAILGLVLLSTPGTHAQPSDVVFTEVFRIGDEAAGDSVFLGRIYTMTVDSQQRLYLTDFPYKGIRVFTGDGVPIGEIGREGEGPGEFSQTPSVHIGPNDALYAWDRNLTRLSIYTSQGQSFVRNISFGIPSPAGLRPSAFLGATEEGFLMHFSSYYSPRSDEAAQMANLVKLVHWNGIPAADTLALLPSIDYVPFNFGGSVGVRYLPYSARPHFALSGDQVLHYGMGDAIDITGRSLAGGDLSHISVPYEPVPLTRAEKEAEVDGISLADLRKQLLNSMASHKPAFNALLLDDAGHMWVRLSRPEGEQTTTWLVLDDSGKVVAKASVPDGTRLVAVREDRAFGELQDEETGAPIAIAWEITY